MPSQNSSKVYVQVTAVFDEDGRMLPCGLIWEDGTQYAIEKVLDCKSAAAVRAGGQGERFTIRVQVRERYLYFGRSTDLSGPNLGK